MTLLHNFHKYGSKVNSHDWLKFAAITLMVIDHIGLYFFPKIIELRLVGRLSFLLFFFLIGYSMSYRITPPLWIGAIALVVVGLITKFPVFTLNILFTVIFCRLLLKYMNDRSWTDKYPFQILIGLGCWAIPTALIIDYGTLAVMLAMCGHYARNRHITNSQYKIFLAGTALCYVVTQVINFHFTDLQVLWLVAGLYAIMYMMYKYHTLTFDNFGTAISWPVMFISRNSLLIYVAHIIIFRLVVAFYLHPELHQHLRWFP